MFQCFSARNTNIRIFWHLPVASQRFKFASSPHVLQAPNISVVAKMEESSPVLSCMDVRYLVTQPTMRIMGPSTSVQPCLPWLLLVQNPGRNHGGIVYTLPPRHGGGTSVTLSSSLVVVFLKLQRYQIFACGFGGFGELIINSSLLTLVVCKTQSCLLGWRKR